MFPLDLIVIRVTEDFSKHKFFAKTLNLEAQFFLFIDRIIYSWNSIYILYLKLASYIVVSLYVK